MMMQNLRSMASRYFSSSTRAGSGGGGSVLATGGLLKSFVKTMRRESSNVSYIEAAIFGYGCYFFSNYGKKKISTKEAMMLRRDRHNEVVAKAESLLLGKK